MTDETIIRIAEESCKVLAKTEADRGCSHLAVSYGALLQAAKANHPDDPFISALLPLDLAKWGDPDATEMHVLFAQLRIALESLAGVSPAPSVNGAARPVLDLAHHRREILTALKEGRLTAEQAATLLESL